MTDGTTYVGLDVHVQTIAVAVARGDGPAEVAATIANTPDALAARLRKLGPAAHVVLTELRAAIAAVQVRIDRFTAALTELAATSAQAPVIAALQTLHGVGVLTAVGIVAEVGDLTRFDRPAQLFAYAGLVPSEHSSGGRQHRGGITKTGNRHLRFLVIEAAWHYARPLALPTAPPPTPAAAIAATARARLHRRFFRLVSRGKSKQTAVVAIARELLGFMWALAHASAVATPAMPVAA